MCPVVGFGPWLGLGKPLVEILPPGQLRGFFPLLAWLGSAVLGYGPVLSFRGYGFVGDLEGRDESKRQGLNLSGSWQQGHSATYNTPSRVYVVCKGFYPSLDGNCASRRLAGLICLTTVTNGTCLWGAEAPYCWSANGRRAHASLLARILT
ncbi:hypothetical protein JHK85_012604 [Glycine max]|nr:hypothetical protein JHK85_012604 [Glycine max]